MRKGQSRRLKTDGYRFVADNLVFLKACAFRSCAFGDPRSRVGRDWSLVSVSQSA